MMHTLGKIHRDGHNLSALIICTVPKGNPKAKHITGDYETIAICQGDNWDANSKRMEMVWECHDRLVEACRNVCELPLTSANLHIIASAQAALADVELYLMAKG